MGWRIGRLTSHLAGEPLTTDRDGRIRIQFGWQRGTAPLPGGSGAPASPTGAATGHAPGNERSGTWVRVAQSVAGPNWGAVFTPPAGTEVLVDFVDGDIDRPIVVGQLHNGQHDLPWPAGVDASANHPGTVSGWHSQHLDGQGANQWLIDDATGQLRMRLASHSAATGWNELSLGHLIQHSGHGGEGHARRGQWLGSGFYGATDGWAVVRAAQGLLLTTSSRPAMGASVASTQMDAAEAVAQLKAARQLGEALSQSARQQGAHGLSSHDGDQAWQHHADQMDPQTQGRYEGSVGGQEAKKAQGRTLTEPVERFAQPLLHLDTPVSASFVTPTSIHLFSGQDTSVSAQGDVHSTSAQSFSAVSGQTTSLYTHSGGIKAITASAGLSLRAHTDAQQIWSEKDLTVQSTTDEIRIQASKSITLTAGQSQIVIEGGNITFTCPGTWTVKGAGHDWSSGGGFDTSLEVLPDSRVTPKGGERNLTAGEVAMARSVFGDGLDYDAVKVHRGGYWLFFGFQDEDTAVTPNGEMYFPGKHFKEDYSLESVGDQGGFIHEMTHVWQYQLGYWVKSIRVPRPNMSYAYTLDAGKQFCDFNMEAQGNICEDYYLAVIRGAQRLMRESKYRSNPMAPELLKTTLRDFLQNQRDSSNLPKVTE
jgi:type VI secretion system secreted protein VgrG